jgi:hypothetical protein
MPDEPRTRCCSRLRAAAGEILSSRVPRWNARPAGRTAVLAFSGLAGSERSCCVGVSSQSQLPVVVGGVDAGCLRWGGIGVTGRRVEGGPEGEGWCRVG